MERNSLIASNQVAFKIGRGCTDVLLHIDFYITKPLSFQNHVTILSTDFEKSFGSISRHVILEILLKWNVGKVFKFIGYFLENRKFQARSNGAILSILPLHNGSPLSVILFLIAFSEIHQITNSDSTK